MTIETATYAVRRGTDLKSCIGSELQDKLVDGDLLVVQRANTTSGLVYDGQVSIESILDDDLLFATDTNNTTYQVSGDKFKSLFDWTLPPVSPGYARFHITNIRGVSTGPGIVPFVRIKGAASVFKDGASVADREFGVGSGDWMVVATGEYVFENSTADWEFGPHTNTSGLTTMNRICRLSSEFEGTGLEHFDTSSVLDMSQAFQNCPKLQAGGMANWNTENVTNMSNMFDSTGYFNRDLGRWDVSNVTNMSDMFKANIYFDQNLSNWCVSNISSEPSGFGGSTWWTQGRKPQWGTCPPALPPVSSGSGKFHITNITAGEIVVRADATVYKNGAIVSDRRLPAGSGDWIVEGAGDYLFENSSANWEFTSSTDTSELTSMLQMFRNNNNFTGTGIEYFDTSNVITMRAAFQNARSFNNAGVSTFETAKVADMDLMFNSTAAFVQDCSGWCVSLITVEPPNFRTGGNHEFVSTNHSVDYQPQWGTCP